MIDNNAIRDTFKKNPEISIIVPVYNVKKYLLRCIRSILNQTYKDFEVLLVDDGSTDGSGALCDKLKTKDSRIKVIHKENGGLSSARNAGLDIVSGKYVTFVDSDDYVSELYLEKLKELCKNDDNTICVVGTQIVKEKEYSSQKKNFRMYSVDGKDFEKLFLGDIAGDSSCAKLFPLKFFKNVRFIDGRILEDLGVTYKLFYQAERVMVSEEKLYYYYQRSGSIMNSDFSIKKSNGVYSYEERLDFIKEKLDKDVYDRFMQQYVAMGLAYYYKIRKYFPNEKRRANELRTKIINGYKECHNSKRWTIVSRIGGFLGCHYPYIIGFLVKIVLKV